MWRVIFLKFLNKSSLSWLIRSPPTTHKNSCSETLCYIHHLSQNLSLNYLRERGRERKRELAQINCRYISLQDTISPLNTIILKNKVNLHIKILLGQQGFSAENLHDLNHIFIKLNSILSPWYTFSLYILVIKLDEYLKNKMNLIQLVWQGENGRNGKTLQPSVEF